jgi:hypothetical protein
MKPTAARTSQDTRTRYDFVNSDYKSERPLVTSRWLVRLDQAGIPIWMYPSEGVIIHGSIAFDREARNLVFVEARSAACQSHPTDRIAMPLLMQQAYLVCVDTENGQKKWEKPLSWPGARNMIYGQICNARIVLSSSESRNDRAHYSLRQFSLSDGEPIWQTDHLHIKNGLFHGEQVHHPVVLHLPDGTLWIFAEPYFHDFQTGERVAPAGAQADWALRRPGHSCGTLSAAGNCVFFRAGNPTFFNLMKAGSDAFTKLAPTRPGCWINIIPASGQLFIPEGSASCVCLYSLQTSMAFVPITESAWEEAMPNLPDIIPGSEARED